MPHRPIHIRDTVKAAHLLLTGYGHWLPNDPRGSGSEQIRKLGLEPLGPIHFGRKREQPGRVELKGFYRRAERLLDHETVWFDERKRECLARAFAEVVRDRGYTCYACAVLRNHTHFVMRTHRDDSFTMLCELASHSIDVLHDATLVPDDHQVWANRPYKVFLKNDAQIRSRIAYVENNPIKEGLPPQRYDWVEPFRAS